MQLNILCVDDFGLSKFELSSILKKININYSEVNNGKDAINILRENKGKYTAIVWSLNSTNFTDFEVIKSIKNEEQFRNIPIIIISKFTDKRYVIKGIEAGACDFIVKPFDENVVLRKLCKVLNVPFEESLNTKPEEDIVMYNFTDMLNKEFKAASRGKYSFSLMLISIMRRPDYCDELDKSNEISETVHKVIKTKLRETDTSFHYGSNNLILLLPFANKKGVDVVEEKVREIFNKHSLIKNINKGYDLVTSCVSMPEDGKIKAKLLEKLEKNTNDG